MADVVKLMEQIIAKQITLGNQVVKSADAASVFRRECGKIKYNTNQASGHTSPSR
ncbi:unnamed protein product [Rhodiola kirilowii]